MSAETSFFFVAYKYWSHVYIVKVSKKKSLYTRYKCKNSKNIYNFFSIVIIIIIARSQQTSSGAYMCVMFMLCVVCVCLCTNCGAYNMCAYICFYSVHNSVFQRQQQTAMEIIITTIIIKQSKQKSFVCVALCVPMLRWIWYEETPLKTDDFDAVSVGFLADGTKADDTIPILNYIKALYKLRFFYIQHQLEFRYDSDKTWLR